MEHALTWWLAIEVLGAIALPYLFLVFPALADRGFGFAKVFACLLLSYLVWIAGTLHLLPNGRGAILLLTLGLAMGALVLLGRHCSELVAAVRRARLALVTYEIVFAGCFAIMVWIRALNPEIAGTEKPMDFAMLNTAVRSEWFPPQDPWLSGLTVNYYYFGYLIAAVLNQLAGTDAALGFNLALAFLFAGAATGITCLVANLVSMRDRTGALAASPPISLRHLAYGGVGVLLLLGIGNLETAFEIARAHGWSNPDVASWVAIKKDEDAGGVRLLGVPPGDAPYNSAHWYPSENWWWWRSTRVIDTISQGRSQDYTINEYPAFSFLLGDLHPHVMALPFVLLALALSLQLLSGPSPGFSVWWRRSPALFLPPLVVLGSIGFINGWDLLPYLGIYVGMGLIRTWMDRPHPWRAWLDWAVWSAAIAGGAVALYAPFYGVLAWQTLSGTGALGGQGPPVVPWEGPGTRPVHFVILWGPALLMVFGLVIAAAFRAARRLGALVASVFVLLGTAWGATELAYAAGGTGGLDPQQLAAMQRGWFLVAAGLAGAVLFRYRALRQEAFRIMAGTPPLGTSVVFTLALIAAAFGLFFICETLRIRDVFGNRMNTVFKLYYQAWVLLAVIGAFTVSYFHERGAGIRGPVRLGWRLAVIVLMVVAGSFWPAALASKTNGFQTTATLDGERYLQDIDPGEAAAIKWLRGQREPRAAVLIEATGGQYSRFARFSSGSGIPSVLGWAGHELQWRGSDAAYRGRAEDIDAVYTAIDKREIVPILRRYGVTYVAVGALEQEKYPGGALSAFGETLPVAYRNDRVTIYRANAGP
ncbi:MAG: hypothetical protein EXR51_11095 [Dehalococcoidia bacterium]|nr:hypothetical protein [Dehalococcoidia bacterium]